MMAILTINNLDFEVRDQKQLNTRLTHNEAVDVIIMGLLR